MELRIFHLKLIILTKVSNIDFVAHLTKIEFITFSFTNDVCGSKRL